MVAIGMTIIYILLSLLLLTKKVNILEREVQVIFIAIFMVFNFYFDQVETDPVLQGVIFVLFVVLVFLYSRSKKLKGKWYLFNDLAVEKEVASIISASRKKLKRQRSYVEYNFSNYQEKQEMKKKINETLRKNPKLDYRSVFLLAMLIVYLVLILIPYFNQ